jgi:pimeloyl-ACP methyl ester carboxylesterase
VAVEGGPGYPSTGSALEYTGTYGPLLRDHDLLLVDNRGTGMSALIDCRRLQRFPGRTSGSAFARIAGRCGRALNRRFRLRDGRRLHASDLFATAYAARDLAAVLAALRLRRIDLYGDSYGTYFVQSFISRHRRRLRSVILDSSYPVRGLSPWYASSGETARRALDAVCARDPGCSAAAPGSATARLGVLLAVLRRAPLRGFTRNLAGRRVRERVDVRTMTDLVQDSASDPVILRELDAAVRAALAGDPAPLLRLAEQSGEYDHGTSTPDYFSDGLYMAVSCTDYPQLFSLAASPARRRAQLASRLRRPPAGAFSPFSAREWLTVSGYSQPYDVCLDWPRPVHRAPPVPVRSRSLPRSIPMLVVGGDLDSLTPLSDAVALAPTLARRVRVVNLRNTVHVTSEGDTMLTAGADCARAIIRRFVRAPARLRTLDARCAGRIPAIHTAGAFPRTLAAAAPATVVSGPDPGIAARRAVTVAAGALADATIRRFYSGARRGPGLRGGAFTAAGDTRVRLGLRAIRFAADATVDGTGAWRPATGAVHGRLTVRGPGAGRVTVTVDWTQRSPSARARVGGAVLTLPAP